MISSVNLSDIGRGYLLRCGSKYVDFWKNQGNVIGYDMNELINRATINTYYNAFKNALRKRRDFKGAIKYFLSFLYCWVKSIVFRIW